MSGEEVRDGADAGSGAPDEPDAGSGTPDDSPEGSDVRDRPERQSMSDLMEGEVRPWTPAVLADLRERPTRRRVALVVATIVGLGLAWFHWFGLFVAGALVGLVSETLRKAIVAGLVVGVLVLVVHVLASPVVGPGEFVGFVPPAVLAIAAGIIAPVWGSLVRGVV